MDFFLFILVLSFIIIPKILFPSKDYKSLGYDAEDVAALQNSSNISLIVDTCSSFYQNDITTTSSVIDNILNFLYGSVSIMSSSMVLFFIIKKLKILVHIELNYVRPLKH